MKTRNLNNGLEYIREGDYYIPNLALPEESRPIGRWGRLHREFQTMTECLLFHNNFKLGVRMILEVMEE